MTTPVVAALAIFFKNASKIINDKKEGGIPQEPGWALTEEIEKLAEALGTDINDPGDEIEMAINAKLAEMSLTELDELTAKVTAP